MKQIFYYVVEKELQGSNYAGEEDHIEETTGNKTVTVYTVGDGKLEEFFNLELHNSDNSEEEINDYIDENVNKMFYSNGYELIQL